MTSKLHDRVFKTKLWLVYVTISFFLLDDVMTYESAVKLVCITQNLFRAFPRMTLHVSGHAGYCPVWKTV